MFPDGLVTGATCSTCLSAAVWGLHSPSFVSCSGQPCQALEGPQLTGQKTGPKAGAGGSANPRAAKRQSLAGVLASDPCGDSPGLRAGVQLVVPLALPHGAQLSSGKCRDRRRRPRFPALDATSRGGGQARPRGELAQAQARKGLRGVRGP